VIEPRIQVHRAPGEREVQELNKTSAKDRQGRVSWDVLPLWMSKVYLLALKSYAHVPAKMVDVIMGDTSIKGIPATM
jgi:hypothetical protein